MKKYMIGLLVTNKYGVLTRIASLFARRGYNIDTLTVGETVNPQVSRMTIMITGNDHDRDQMIKQLMVRLRKCNIEVLSRSSI